MGTIPQIAPPDNLSPALFRDRRAPCSNPTCDQLCVSDDYCTAACRAHDDAVMRDMAQRWERHMLRHAGAQPIPRHYTDVTQRILLGHRATSDTQWHVDQDAGGLAALACSRAN